MNLRRFVCALVALMMAVTGVAFAEDDSARIAELEAKLAEAQALADQYYPYFIAQVVAEYDGGYIFKADVQAEYDYYENMYSQYGISLTDYGYDTQIKQQIVEGAIQAAIELKKAAELGLDQLPQEAQDAAATAANEALEYYITNYITNFQGEGVTDEDARTACIEWLATNGVTYDDAYANELNTAMRSAVYDKVTADVAVTEEDVKAAYDAALASDEAAYAENAASYEKARANGDLITWNPEGYRTVKHVLIKFDEDQAARYTELTGKISTLNDEMAKATAPAEEAAATEQPADAEATETPAPRAEAEIQADLDAANADLEALYQELMPEAQAVIDRFGKGEKFEDLVAELGEDPGMTQEPSMTTGYYVCASQGSWETAFNDGAMAIAAPGEISAPVYGTNGIHIIYYLDDVPAGAIDLETVREAITANALSEKLAKTYSDQLAAWSEELGVVYHLDNF